ncbi:response regulator transcription factor [Flavobacteriaceae bacterium S356]|uniref:Response regulator transcription factor n=1 Tax=Asprobacillus argus TaxID=3076534 RepID=A0ABU3LFS9_9FLAO|nr:response regulator transcription factor [Flavobacteriaceae bacterium S356]
MTKEKIHCIIVDDEPIARDIIATHVEKIPSLNLIASCKNVIDATEVLRSQKVDLVFLDINMPEISGLSLAKTIQNKTKVIFTTAYREYAIDGFDLHAVDYLLKPISFDRFLTAIHKFFDVSKGNQAQEKAQKSSRNEHFFVRSERKMIKINFDDIFYVESLSDYVKLHLDAKTIITRETISNIEAKLPVSKFLRTHRSFIVSFDRISSYTNEYVEVADKAISISRSYKEQVLKKLENN